jgi:hypothetical protein
MNLDTFLREELPLRHREIEAVSKVAGESACTILQTFDQARGDWPYEVSGDGEPPPDRGFSFSTASMTLFATAVLTREAGKEVERNSIRSGLLRKVRLDDLVSDEKLCRVLKMKLGKVFDLGKQNLKEKIAAVHKGGRGLRRQEASAATTS